MKMSCWSKKKKILFNLLFIFRPSLNKCHVVRDHVLAQQVFQVSRESLDLRDQQVLQDHMGIVDPRDSWVREGARATKAPEADAVSKVLKELRDSRDQLVLEEVEAKKVLKGLQVLEELMGCWWKTGNSAFTRTWMMAEILAW